MPNHPKSTCQIFSAYRSPKSRGRCSNPKKLRFSKALGGLGIRQQRVFPQGPHILGAGGMPMIETATAVSVQN